MLSTKLNVFQNYLAQQEENGKKKEYLREKEKEGGKKKRKGGKMEEKGRQKIDERKKLT